MRWIDAQWVEPNHKIQNSIASLFDIINCDLKNVKIERREHFIAWRKKQNQNNTFETLQNHVIFDSSSKLISLLYVIDASILLLLSSVLRQIPSIR